MSKITHRLDFDALEHVWEVRVPFAKWDNAPQSVRDEVADALRRLADVLGVTIEAQR